jgi:hypothetical protein
LNSPIRFADAGMTNGRFRTLLLGTANATYVVEGSSNNVDWFSFTTNSSASGIINFVDPRSTVRTHYYRAR